MMSIIRVHRNYEDGAWMAYDVAYRRQALARQDLHWSRVGNALYNEAFTGRARAIPRCKHCLGENDASGDCVFAPVPSDESERCGGAPKPVIR